MCCIEIAFSGALGREDFNDSEIRIAIIPCNDSYDTNFASTKIKIVKEISKTKKDNYLKFKQ
jgi:hypothetical protein